MNFRYDLNGLRAIAVIAVVLFHFNPQWVPGGFAGVDVFFVISGFLMTGIIFKGLENNSFNLLKFYVARATRIIPALAFLCLVLLVLGWFYLTLFDYRFLVKHVAASISFLSNILYWQESGYFDAASHEKWLLHTWSLSVEWQFYVLYPIILLVIKTTFSINSLKHAVLIGTLLGFVFNVVATMKWPDSAYYLLHTRAWEMMLGGLAFFYSCSLSQRKKRVLEMLGLSLILASYTLVSSDIAWPGHFALFPVLGTFLVIIANQQSSNLTNNIVFQYLGKWSYSIYLWHWPIVVLFNKFEIKDYEIAGVLASVLLAVVSYLIVEKKRFRKRTLSFLSLLPFVFSCIVFTNASFVDYPESILGHNINISGQVKFIGLDKDHLINTEVISDIDFIGIGDSNLVHFSYGVKDSGKTKVLFSGAASCLTFPDYTRKPYGSFMDEAWLVRCSTIYKRVIEYPEKDIIWAQNWQPTDLICISNHCNLDQPVENYYLVLEEQIIKMSELVGDSRSINLIGWSPAPEYSLVNCTKNKLERCSGDMFTQSSEERLSINSKLKNLSNRLNNVNFIDLFGAICSDNFDCKTVSDGKNLFFDKGHLSAFGALKLWPYVENNLQKGK